MAVAWATIAGLVLLLPGFTYFIGFAIPEKFSRETGVQSVIGQLASVVLASLLVHILLLAGISLLPIPQVSFEVVLGALNAGGIQAMAASEIGENLEANFPWIAAYLVLSASCGLLLGWGLSSYAIRYRHGLIPYPPRHRWTYDLVEEPTTVAYVLSKLSSEGRYVIYRGFIAHFGLQPDGRFAYVALRGASRMTRKIVDQPAELPVRFTGYTWTEGPERRVIGQGQQSSESAPEVDLLHIDGTEIANMAFVRYPLRSSGDASTGSTSSPPVAPSHPASGEGSVGP